MPATFYGTLKSEIERIWSREKRHLRRGRQRRHQPQNYFGDKALAVFVKVPSLEILESAFTPAAQKARQPFPQAVQG